MIATANEGTATNTTTGTATTTLGKTLLAAFCIVTMGAASAQNLALKAAGEDDEFVANAYYETIDPNNKRLTQDDWEEVNGFNDPLNTVVTVSGYKNEGDLGDFFRLIQMVVDKRPGFEDNIAFTTANYIDPQDAIDDANEGVFTRSASIVNMEYSPGPEEDRITKFYVYNADGVRQIKTMFSINGEELFMPAACYSCHGGDDDAEGPQPDGYNEGSGETNSTFLAFDINTMSFEHVNQAALEDEFKAFNQAVLHTDPTKATKKLINGLYGGSGLPLAVQNTDYIPADWAGDPDDVELYREVIVPSCRLCHTASDKKLLKLSYWKDNPGKIRDSVFDEMFMPNSVPSYTSFMNSVNPHQPQLLLDALERYEQ